MKRQSDECNVGELLYVAPCELEGVESLAELDLRVVVVQTKQGRKLVFINEKEDKDPPVGAIDSYDLFDSYAEAVRSTIARERNYAAELLEQCNAIEKMLEKNR